MKTTHFVYIIFSQKLDKYYIGQTHDVNIRLERHNRSYYGSNWSAKGKPWTLFLSIPCESVNQAMAIEKHIKAMKSQVYVQNLKKYPEIIEKLKSKFPISDYS